MGSCCALGGFAAGEGRLGVVAPLFLWCPGYGRFHDLSLVFQVMKTFLSFLWGSGWGAVPGFGGFIWG